MMPNSQPCHNQHIEKFLKAVDDVVPSEGWTKEALAQVAAIASLNDLILWELCPDGVESAVALFCESADNAMRDVPQNLPWENMGIGFRVQKLIERRLAYLADHKGVEAKTFYWLCVPHRSVFAFNIGFRTADLIWQLAENNLGDEPIKSFSYYSKRMVTLAILSSTTVFWLQDNSPSHEASYAFLQRRLKNHIQFTKWTHKVKKRFRPANVV